MSPAGRSTRRRALRRRPAPDRPRARHRHRYSGLTALQGAVLQFLVDLPPDVAVTIASASTVADVGTDRQAAISAVRDLSPTDSDDVPFAPVVAAALLTPPVDVEPRALVVASDADVSTGAAADVDATRTRDVVWSVQLAAAERPTHRSTTSPQPPAARWSRSPAPTSSCGLRPGPLGVDGPLRGHVRGARRRAGRDHGRHARRAAERVVASTTPMRRRGQGRRRDATATSPTSLATLPHRAPTRASADDGGTSPWWWVLGFAVLLGGWALLFGVVLRRRWVWPIRPTDGGRAAADRVPSPQHSAAPVPRCRHPTPPPVAEGIPRRTAVDARSHRRPDRASWRPSRRSPSVPSPSVRRDRTGSLGRSGRGRPGRARRAPPPLAVGGPVSIVLAFEAAASAWLDDDACSRDAFAVLTDDDLPVDSTLPSVLRGLRTGLLLTPACAEPEVPEHLFGAMAGASPGSSGRPTGAPPRADPSERHRPPYDAGRATSSRRRAAAEIERDGRYGRAGGVVARALLATWPSRHGHLDRCPLLLSPSASPPDGPASPSSSRPSTSTCCSGPSPTRRRG